MIAWSNNKLKFTSGIGALCTTGLLADLSRQTIPAWIVIAIAMLPLLVFLFIRPDEMRRSVVLPFQVFASSWYLLLAVSLSGMFVKRGEMTQGWPVYFIGLVIGSIPCVIILRSLLLHGFGGVVHPSEPVSIRDSDDHNRVYRAACDIIQPYMRLHGTPEEKVTRNAATELKQAIGMLDAVTTYAPENWSAFWIKGKAYQALANRKDARVAFKSAFDLQDKNPDVAREYVRVPTLRGRCRGTSCRTTRPSFGPLRCRASRQSCVSFDHRRQAQGGISGHCRGFET
jgi:hypothetical protein